MMAGEALRQAATSALAAVAGLALFDGPPLQAPFPHAVLDSGLETDWSHKSGEGREVRLALTVFDQGERPVRLRALMAEAAAALAGLNGDAGAWQVVTMHHLRSRLVRQPNGPWAGVIEFRARMLKR